MCIIVCTQYKSFTFLGKDILKPLLEFVMLRCSAMYHNPTRSAPALAIHRFFDTLVGAWNKHVLKNF